MPWGCRVITTNWVVEVDEKGNILEDYLQKRFRGIITWNGVEMDKCGQADTIRGALDFTYATEDSKKIISTVTKSSIHHCPGFCSNIDNSALISITDNNFYVGRPILMRIYHVN